MRVDRLYASNGGVTPTTFTDVFLLAIFVTSTSVIRSFFSHSITYVWWWDDSIYLKFNILGNYNFDGELVL